MPDARPAISLHAPWAWAIMHAGKDVENRGPSFPRWHRGQPVMGRVWIHASLWPGKFDPMRPLRGPAAIEWADELAAVDDVLRDRASGQRVTSEQNGAMWTMRGHIVGSVEVYGFLGPNDSSDSIWRQPGSTAILVRDPKPLACPVPASGSLGWWTPSEGVRAALKVSAC